jgi:glyoxylase-like metal-dependent hydrolase (beta-lactamase superfamily II)
MSDAESLPEVERNAARWGFELGRASHLLLTHAHFDHASHAAELQRRGLKVVASPEAADAIAAGDDRCIGYSQLRTFEPCEADIVIRDGETLDVDGLSIVCHAAPGHADGLIVYEIDLSGERVWFTGDLLEAQHAHSTVSLPWTGGPDIDRAGYIESLKRLRSLPPCDHLLPGHGPPAIGSGSRLLDMVFTRAMLEWR